MNLKFFQREYDGAPFDIFEFADIAEEVEDDRMLSEAATELLGARTRFILALNAVNVEMG